MIKNNTEYIVIFVNLTDINSAKILAEILLKQNLIACINIMSPCESHYIWENKLETSIEIPVIIKTTRNLYKQVEEVILQHHSYAVPEIIALPIVDGLENYLSWVKSNVKA